MKPLVQSNRPISQTNNFKSQAAKRLIEIFVEKVILLIKRQSFHQVYLHSIREDSYDGIQEALDDTPGEAQRNLSFIEGSDTRQFRTGLTTVQPTLIPQKSSKKLNQDQQDLERALALSLNRSFTKAPTYVKEQEGQGEKASEFNPSDLKWAQPNGGYDEDKKFKLDVFSVQTKSYVSSNLRIGDIIYFKSVIEYGSFKKNDKPYKMVGILSGDGIASNRLECVDRNVAGVTKNANFLFKRSLFRVEPSSKYYYQKLYQKMKDSDRESDSVLHEGKLSFLKKKYDEEKEENESEFRNQVGQPVLYGQLIHLKHLYSNCYLTLQPNALSLQYGCVKLTLEEQGSEMSNFKFMASGNLKSQEDVVTYSDPVHIVNNRGDYYMHVWDEAHPRNSVESGLEVNGAETSSNWKLLRFMDFEEFQEYENNTTFLESGDIVKLILKKTGATLSVPPKNLGPMISTRDIFINNEAEDNYGPQRTTVTTKIIESKIPALPIDLETPAKYTVSDLWEVQRRNAFVGGFARSDETFRLKNVSTGLFLCQDPRSERLELTPDGNREECYFLFRPKKNDDQRHRIEYSELLRIQTFNGSYLQQHRSKDIGDLCGPKVADSARILFHFKKSSYELSSAGNRLASLFPCFHNFHCFLQFWGLQQAAENIYDYNKAVESEKDLDIEIDNLKEGLENLEDFLKTSSNDLSFKFKQRVLIEQRIIDILILITELIETKTGGNRVRKEIKKLEGKLRGGEDWGYIEKSPQNIARKYLDKPVRQIYNILLLSTRDSIQVSRIIIKNSPFFTRQFAYYRKEAGNLLKEAFKNAAQLDEYDPHNEQLVRWVGELDMIKETENNLPLQTLYLEIISLACIDIRMKGVVKYQDKVLQEFFSPNSHFLKGLVTFTRRNNRVYVSFARKAEVTKEEFLEVNPCLTLNEINYEEYEGKCFFSLQDLSIVKNKNVELIVDYLSAVLWLFYSLCKNRNQDGINHIKGIGLQSETLMSCMQDDLIHIKLKTGFILLYEALFIDVDPYKSIKDCSNHCYIWEEIEHKKLSEYTYLWHSLSNYNKVDWMKDYDKTKVNIINDYILDFWMNGKNIIRLEIAGSHTLFSNSDSEYLQKANLIHAMLEFTKNAVNLGFTNTVTNNQILYAVTNLFAAFRNGQEKDKWAVWEVDSWISKFVQANPLSTRHEIFMQIYLEALEILEVMADLRISLQVAGFLKVFKICFENGASLDRDSFNAVFSLFFQKYGLNVPIPKLIENVDKSMSDLDLQPVRIPVVSGIMNSHLNEVVREIANPETNEVIKSGIIFINMLNELAEKDKFLEKQTRKVLKRFFDQREALLDDLRRIEIISGKKEIEIYTEFDSQERLEIQINKVLQDDENLRQNYKIDLSSYKTRIIDINNSLNRMITRFKERKRDLKLTLKTQNIMRNLNIHISVLKILKLSYREQEHREVFKSAISVLYYFCKANADNQRELYPHIPDLLALVEKRLKPSKLIAQIFCRKKTDRECHYFIDIIFSHLASQDPLYYINHTEYLIILRSLLIDERKNAIHDNQRVIMSRLMKNKDFLSKLEFRIPEKTRVNDIKDEDIAILYYQAENVLLLANLCLESKLGMMQAKKAISYEELRGLLTNNTTPFIQKKAFLRCLFQIYITNWADLNQEFDKKNMVEILSGIVLPDLKIFMNYLEGVIEIPSESTKVEKQRRAERLRETIAKYKSSHLEGRDEKALVGLVSMGKKLLPPIAGAGPENRKKLRDQSEYWEYLNSGKSWNLKQDGLLYFIIDCFYEIDQRGWTIDEGLKDVLGQIKSSLIRMNDVLLQIEEEISKEGSQIRLSKYSVLINECIDRLPDKKAGRKGKSIHMQADGLAYNLVQGGSRNNYDRKPEEKPKEEENLTEPSDPVSLILQKIKSFILKRKMTLEDFMALFRNVEDKMNIEEFRNKLKTFLGNTVKLSEIDEFIANIRKSKRGSHELDNTVSLSKVYKKLQKSFERDRAVNYKDLIKEEQGALLEDLNSPDSLNVLRSMKNFTNQYVEFNLNNEEANTELREVITALFSEPKKKITKKKLEEYEILLGKLLKIFNKKHYEIYLLRMLKYLLKNFEEMVSFEGNLEVNDSDSEDEDQEMHNYNAKDEFKKIQLVFAKSDALKLCLNSLKEGVPKKQVFEAVEVMNFMLKTGNKQVQKHILDILKKDPSMSGFFNYIKIQLWQTIDIFKKLRETEEVSQPDSSAAAKGRIILPMPKNLEPETILDLKIAENIIRMTQLFCENCFIDFQNFLRIQASSAKTTIVSTNLVNELSNFLVDLQLTDPNIFQNPRMFPLVSASLKALIDFCMGPCQENQKVLGSQRHLISFINSFLDKDINFQSSNDDDLQMIDTFSHVIKFLLALVNGNKSIQVKEFLLNQLSVDALIRKLVVIFTTKIANRDINIFRQERRCPQGRGGQHAHGCAENFCVINFLTPKDFLIIESAFNVYILLTIFTEEFNDNPKLEKFKYDRLNPEEKNRLYYLEGKHKSYFSDQNKKRLFNVSSDLLMQYSQTQLKKTQIHPGLEQQLSSKKFKFPMASLRAEDDPVLSPDSSSMEALDPSSPHPLVKKKSTIRNASFLTPMEKYRNSVVKQLMNSPTDKNLMTLDRDLQKLQEEEMFKEFFSLKERYIVGKARRFFRPFINSVEVNQDGQLSKNYFQVPFECDYITENIREHLIFKAARDSDIERIEHLFYNIPLYRGELEHRQKISRNRSIEWLVKRWRFFKDIAYVAVIASNIVMLASYDSTSERSDLSNALNKLFMIIQIALSAFVLLLCVYERWPIATFKKSALTTESSKKKNALKKTLAIEKNQTSPYILIARYFRERVDKISSEISNSRMSYGLIALNVLFDKENFYNILYLVLTIIAFALNPLVNCILLLDIVKRSKELRAIIKSITHNLKKLVMIILLGIIIMYFYAILGLENFHNDFEEVDINCDKLIYCWTSIINYGFRAAPGVGDILKGVDMSEHEYWGRWVYDLSFFILITIIFLYIILGIIIDTFAQLRDLQNNQLRKIEETCFICGLNKADFDTKGNGWHEHIYKEHNVYAYLNFSIYVEKKDMSECNGVEKYVKGLIEKKDINFVPQGTALALQE